METRGPGPALIRPVAGLLALLATLAGATPALAAEVRGGDSATVGANETINDDLYIFGNAVEVRGTVNGDVVAAGNTVTISGPVSGSINAAGNALTLAGPVGGSARLAGNSLTLAQPVGGDLLAAGATLQVDSAARIGRDLLVGAGRATVGGPVGRTVRGGVEELTLGGPVGGDVRVEASTLRLAGGAAVQGDLAYTSRQEAELAPGASVRGRISRSEPPVARTEPTGAAAAAWGVLGWLRALVGLTLLGLLLGWLFPGFSRRAAETVGAAPWRSLGLGFALLVAVPVAALLLFILGLTIGGWWLALGLLVLYVLALPVGYVMAAYFVGLRGLGLLRRTRLHPLWGLVLGLVALAIVGLVPVLGGLVGFAALLVGLGALALTLVADRRGPRSARPVLSPES